MASSYSSRLKLELMETGANANTWGNNTNNNLETLDAFTGGYLAKSVAGSANVTLTTANADPNAEASNKVLDLYGILTGNIVVEIPQVENNYLVYNNTSGAYTLNIGSGGSGVQIPQGEHKWVYCDGTNVTLADLSNTNAASLTSGSLDDARLSANVVKVSGATFTGNVSLNDGVYLNVGTGNDLKIHHDGSNSYIQDTSGTGNLIVDTNIFQLRTSGGGETMFDATQNAGVNLYFNNSSKLVTTTNGIHIQNGSLGVGTDAAATDGQIRATDDITAYYSSDVLLKENIKNIPSASEKIEQLNGVLFDWKQEWIDKNGGEDGYFIRRTDVGVIAQDVEKVLPEIVGTRPNGLKAVKYDRLCALLIEGFKELKKEIKELKGIN